MTAKPSADSPPIVIVPPNTLDRIDSIWAFISVDAEGNEGVCAAMLNGIFAPLIAADEDRLASLRPIAIKIAKETGITVRLIKLSSRTELEVIEP